MTKLSFSSFLVPVTTSIPPVRPEAHQYPVRRYQRSNIALRSPTAMRGASGRNNPTDTERQSLDARTSTKTDSGQEMVATQLRPKVTIAKKTVSRRTARPNATVQGARAKAQKPTPPKSPTPRKNAASTSETTVLQSTLTKLLKSTVEENSELRREVQTLRFEIVEIREEIIRRCNDYKAREEKLLEDSEMKRDAQFEKMCKLVTDLISGARQNGLSSQGGSSNGEVSLQQRADVMKEYVKLFTALQVLDPHRGSDVFGAPCTETYPLDDYKAVVESAKLVLGSSASDAQIAKLLDEELKITKKDRSTNQGVGSFAAQGESRAHDNIRNKMVDAFFAHLPFNHELRIGSSASKEAKQQCAISLFNSGAFKTDREYENSWLQAWIAARDEAYSTASTSLQNLTSFYSDAELPELPFLADETSNSSAISMTLKSIPGIKSRGLRLSHGPSWARETLTFHEKLSVRSDENETSGTMKFGRLQVTKLLTTEEIRILSVLRG